MPSTSGQPANPSVSYRPDIDGLRGVAVLAVMAFHAFPSLVPGGFIGVDVFFVISGFLITQIIYKGVLARDFTFTEFYSRRVRRIFPALLTILVACQAAGWLLLFPDEFAQLNKHTFTGALFSSNLGFLREGGYFDAASEHKPLLHLWSLGIEEQFYIAWPIILVFLSRAGRKWILGGVAAIALVSFAANVILAQSIRSVGFYLPFTRFWELLLGSLPAIALATKDASAPRAPGFERTATALIGFFLIAIASLSLDENALFPGWWALAPTSGTLLILAAGSQSWLNRKVLSHPLLVSIGLFSYPLYLWHWPILSFARIITAEQSNSLTGLLSFASLGPAWLTYRYIEKPIRSQTMTPRLIRLLILGAALLAVIGLSNFLAAGSTARLSKAHEIIAATSDSSFPRNKRDSSGVVKIVGNPDDVVLLIGDSHIDQYYSRIEKTLASRGGGAPSAHFATVQGCLPMPGTEQFAAIGKCGDSANRAFRLAQDPRVRTVVIGAYWEHYYDLEYRPSRPLFYNVDDESKSLMTWESPANERNLERFTATLSSLTAQGKEVYIVLSNPAAAAASPKYGFSRLSGEHTPRALDRLEFENRIRPINSRMKKIALETGAKIIDPVVYLCEDAACPTVDADGTFIYRDANHLRSTYVARRAAFIDQVLN